MRCPFLSTCETTLCGDASQDTVGENRPGLLWGICKNGERDWGCPHYDSLFRASEFHARMIDAQDHTSVHGFRISHLNRIGGYPTVYRDLR
jgi:hypothetical protein